MKIENHVNYNCEVTLTTGETYKIYANWMHNNAYDTWRGWHCAAGQDRIFINSNLDVFSGECRNEKLGNIKTGWKLNNDKSICVRDRCTGCTDDLISEKEKQE